MNIYTLNGVLNPAFPSKFRKEVTQDFLPLNTTITSYADLYSQCEHDELGKFTVRSGYKPVFYEEVEELEQHLIVYQVRGMPTVFISLSAERIKAQQAKFNLIPVLNLKADTDLNIFKPQRSQLIQQAGYYDITQEELQKIKTLHANA